MIYILNSSALEIAAKASHTIAHVWFEYVVLREVGGSFPVAFVRAGEAGSSPYIHFRTGTLRRRVQAHVRAGSAGIQYTWSQLRTCRITVACRDGNIYTVKNGQAHDDAETPLRFATCYVLCGSQLPSIP